MTQARQMTADEMQAVGFIPANASEALKKELHGAIAPFEGMLKNQSFEVSEIDKHIPGVYQIKETPVRKAYRMQVMKASLKAAEKSKEALLSKSFIGTAANFTPYDLQAPAKSLVPWLYPLREALPRVQRPNPGTTANWKTIIKSSSSFSKGVLPAMPWVNQGQRAPQINLAAIPASANYATIGREGSVSFEAEAASQGFDDLMALQHFFTMETVMTMEEDSLLGGNNSLALGTASKPVGSQSGSGSFTGTFYGAIVGLTYEGYRNFTERNGYSSSGVPQVTGGLLPQQQASIVTPDGKTMTVNGGCGQLSAISTTAAAPSSSTTATFTWTPKNGEVAWLIYIGTSNSSSAMYLTALVVAPTYSFTAAPSNTSNEALSALTSADFSQNNGTAGGQSNQVTAFDGLLTQAWNNNTLNPQNAYTINLDGAFLTTSGKGNVNEIDAMLIQMWNLYKVSVDIIYVNAQELANITSRVLNGSSSPLLRILGDKEGYDITGAGVISFYHNPYMLGGTKIPIMIHPTIPPGTILGYAKTLPSYYKSNEVPNVAEVLTRRDYYGQQWPVTTREYQYGVYSEQTLAVYAPFCLGIIAGVGNG